MQVVNVNARREAGDALIDLVDFCVRKLRQGQQAVGRVRDGSTGENHLETQDLFNMCRRAVLMWIDANPPAADTAWKRCCETHHNLAFQLYYQVACKWQFYSKL